MEFKYELANWHLQNLSIRRFLLIRLVSSRRRIRLSYSRLNVKSIAPARGKDYFPQRLAPTLGRLFFSERKRVAVTVGGSPTDRRRYETSPRRNSTRISPLRAAHLQHLCLPRLQRSRIRRVPSPGDLATHVHPYRGAHRSQLAFPCSPLPAMGPALRDRRKQCQGLARAERAGPCGLSALRRDARCCHAGTEMDRARK